MDLVPRKTSFPCGYVVNLHNNNILKKKTKIENVGRNTFSCEALRLTFVAQNFSYSEFVPNCFMFRNNFFLLFLANRKKKKSEKNRKTKSKKKIENFSKKNSKIFRFFSSEKLLMAKVYSIGADCGGLRYILRWIAVDCGRLR